MVAFEGTSLYTAVRVFSGRTEGQLFKRRDGHTRLQFRTNASQVEVQIQVLGV